jgi:hypothetical protein
MFKLNQRSQVREDIRARQHPQDVRLMGGVDIQSAFSRNADLEGELPDLIWSLKDQKQQAPRFCLLKLG